MDDPTELSNEPWGQDDVPTEPGVEPNAYPPPAPLPPEEEAPPTERTPELEPPPEGWDGLDTVPPSA